MKWAAVTVQTKSEGDFQLLTKMLRGLGFRADELEDYKKFRLQMFRPSDLILEVVHREDSRSYPDLELTVSDPDSAVDVIRKQGLQITDDHSGPEPRLTGRFFDVRLPGGTVVRFTGIRTAIPEPPYRSHIEGMLAAAGKTFAIVVSRFNSFITERLLAGAVDGLRRCGVDMDKGYEIVRVPGSFEIPSVSRTLASTGKYDAILCIGCLLRGDTAHYDVIVNEVTRGIGQSAQETGVPHAFGVLTCDTLVQAIDRAGLKMGNKGFEAALAAVEMASLTAAVSHQPSAVSKTGARSASSSNKIRVNQKGKRSSEKRR